MRSRITPDLLRISLWVGTLTYCGLAWCWHTIDTIRHPDEDGE